MTNPLNEDDIGELRSLRFKIKSVLENPHTKTFELWGCMLAMEKLYTKFKSEGKEIPETEDSPDLNDMKLVASRVFDAIREHLDEKEREDDLEN